MQSSEILPRPTTKWSQCTVISKVNVELFKQRQTDWDGGSLVMSWPWTVWGFPGPTGGWCVGFAASTRLVDRVTSMWSTCQEKCLCGAHVYVEKLPPKTGDRQTDEHMNRHHGLQYKIDKSEDDNGSRAVFDDVDCFRSQGWGDVIIFDQVIKMIKMMWYEWQVISCKMSKTRFRSTTFKTWPLLNL